MEPEDVRALIEAAIRDDAHAAAGLEAEWPLIVHHASVDPAARAELADLAPALAARAEELDGAHWLALLLRVLHEEPFVAIEPSTGTGIAGAMSGVADTFQLHTLLMSAWPAGRGGGLLRRRHGHPPVPAAIADNARGIGPQDLGVGVVGRWNLYTYRALRDDRLPDDPADTTEWIWNEGLPAEIPSLDGHRVILLGPPTYERTWNAARLFGDLPATLDERVLERDEVHRWLEAIAGVKLTD